MSNTPASTIRTVAVPGAPTLKYVLWDGTAPVDSQALGVRLNRSRWLNQVRVDDQFAIAQAGQPAVLQPAGVDGMTLDDTLLFRGMFEIPQAILGMPLRSESSGHYGDFVAVSAHGLPGFMFTESGVPIAMSRPIETTASDWRNSLGQWQYAPQQHWAGSAPKVALFSACRQLQGQPQQFYWSRMMRCPDPVRTILSYRQTAPAASSSAAINRRFFRNLQHGETFVDAWHHAHGGRNLSWRWAALSYRASTGDTMTSWMHTGRPASRPDPGSDILYFDEQNPTGRVVTEPQPEVDCWLTPRGSSARLPPWYLCANGALLDLQVRLLDPAARLLPGDRIFVMAVQVRGNYHTPFDIRQLFTFEDQKSWEASGRLTISRRVHDERFGLDTYGVAIEATGPTAPNWSGQSVTLPIQLGQAQNDGFPLYHFHIAVRGPGGRRFGLQSPALEDDFQFCMFRLPDMPEPPRHR